MGLYYLGELSVKFEFVSLGKYLSEENKALFSLLQEKISLKYVIAVLSNAYQEDSTL